MKTPSSVRSNHIYKLNLLIGITAIYSSITHLVKANNETAIFYNVFIPPETRVEDLSHHLDIIKNQLEYRERSEYAEAPLYYFSIGKDIIDFPNCVNCQKLGHTATGDETLILSKVHEFCTEHPEKRVAYIHNRPTVETHESNEMSRRMLSKAVFSDECFLLKNPLTRTSDEKCKCNVCSARFSPLPHYHTSGNMWVADCAYISKLIPLVLFGQKMNHVVKFAPIERFGLLRTISEPFVGRTFGHWVYSHPDICPCDVYPGPFTWNHDAVPLHDEWEPQLVHAPRFLNLLDYEKYYEKFVTSEDKSRRELVSLAARIHEWKSLYGQVPNELSWVWKYYDEGADYFLSFYK